MSGSQAPPGTADASGADPSMEDILASIRRILSEDEKDGAVAEAPAPAAPPAEPAPAMAVEPAPAVPVEPPAEDEDVLVLDSSMMVANPGPETPLTAAEPPPPPPEPPPVAPATPLPVADDLELLAPATAAAATASVSGLMRALANERASQVYRGGPTIEDLVREEIRPILKDWLDAHLPPIVERLVRTEIERVVGRATP